MNHTPGLEQALVFDTMVLSAFAKADRLDLLGSLLSGTHCVVTDIVLDEARRGLALEPQLATIELAEWLTIGHLASDEELTAFLRWTQRIGSGDRDIGEASVFAYAELHGAVSVSDDQAATRVARAYELEVHGTLWLLCSFCLQQKLTEHAAGNIIDSLSAVGLRLPCTGAQFPSWARQQNLLAQP